MGDGNTNRIHVSSVSVKGDEKDRSDLVREFLENAPGRSQAAKAKLLGANGPDRSMLSIWSGKLKGGEPIHLQDATLEAVERAVLRLRGEDPHEEAFLDGVQAALSRVDAAVSDLRVRLEVREARRAGASSEELREIEERARVRQQAKSSRQGAQSP